MTWSRLRVIHRLCNIDINGKTYRNLQELTGTYGTYRTVKSAIENQRTIIMSEDLTTKISSLTVAIDKGERRFPALLERASIYQRQKKFDEAIADFNDAMEIARQRGRREEIGKCHFKLGLVLYGQKKYTEAMKEIESAIDYNCKEPTLEMWKTKIDYDMKRLKSDQKVETKDNKSTTKSTTTTTASELPENSTSSTSTSTSIDAINKHAPLKVKIRDDWYQTSDSVVITIFAKNIKEQELQVNFSSSGVSITFPTGAGSEYNYNIEPLFDDIITLESSYRVFGTKLEVTLKKVTSQKWPTLESSDQAATPSASHSSEGPLSYPTSSKKAVNWASFKLEDEEDAEGKNESEFFSQLYANTDDDSRRAMMKSYVESNGTVLTTNWDEAKAKTFETSPPEGMEPKKWGT